MTRSALSALRRLGEQRSPEVALGLAAAALLLWFSADAFQAQIACSRQVLRLAVDQPRWQPHWQIGPWCLGAAALLLAGRRLRSAGAVPELRQRLLWSGCLVAGMFLLRWAALWDPLCYLFPYLSLLWAPHATWAVGLFVLGYLHLPDHASCACTNPTTRTVAASIFLLGSVVYAAYALYFCQVTMVHGDEGHYLRVTQSLLHDGDIDLADDLGLDGVRGFHTMDIDVHRAPASPPGKVYSIHPVGLSVLLVPPYWAGLERWQNPRLACALSMALLTAACLALGYTWIVRLGLPRYAAACAVGIAGATVPLFAYSNQLYPDVPAVAVALLVLAVLAHWQIPGGGYRSLGRQEPLLLGALGALLAALPFLHPRYLPLAGVLAVPVVLQAWHGPRRRLTRGVLGAVAVVAAGAHLGYNLSFSGDWMGPFRPGNAVGEDALRMGTCAISLPGHWLAAGKGLLNPSPVYLLSLVGWISTARHRDRRVLVLGALYATTAVVNGLHPNWTFGYCPPARFLLTAMPALLYGLAAAMPLIRDRAITLFAAAVALSVSWDHLAHAMVVPEQAYESESLLAPVLAGYYPFDLHFFPSVQTAFPVEDLAFWGLLAASLCCLLGVLPLARRSLRWGLLVLTAILPFLWGNQEYVAARLRILYMLDYSTRQPRVSLLRLSDRYASVTGTESADGLFSAREPENSPGVLIAYRTPFLQPGIVVLYSPDLRVEGTSGQASGHLVFSHREVVPAWGDWARYLSAPLFPRAHGGSPLLGMYAAQPGYGYVYAEYSGMGGLSLGTIEGAFLPARMEPLSVPLDHLVFADAGEQRGGTAHRQLGPGHYRARFEVRGAALSTVVQRQPAPVSMAVYAGTGEEESSLAQLVSLWLEQRDRPRFLTVGRQGYVRPLAESFQAPWWTAVPFAGRQAWELDFSLDSTQEVWFAAKYEGPADLRVTGVALYRQQYPQDIPWEGYFRPYNIPALNGR